MLRIKGKSGYRIYIQYKILFSSKTVIRLMFFKLSIFYIRFAIFRRCVDAEMKDSTRQGVSLQTKKEEKEAVTDEDESVTDTKKEAQKVFHF